MKCLFQITLLFTLSALLFSGTGCSKSEEGIPLEKRIPAGAEVAFTLDFSKLRKTAAYADYQKAIAKELAKRGLSLSADDSYDRFLAFSSASPQTAPTAGGFLIGKDLSPERLTAEMQAGIDADSTHKASVRRGKIGQVETIELHNEGEVLVFAFPSETLIVFAKEALIKQLLSDNYPKADELSNLLVQTNPDAMFRAAATAGLFPEQVPGIRNATLWATLSGTDGKEFSADLSVQCADETTAQKYNMFAAQLPALLAMMRSDAVAAIAPLAQNYRSEQQKDRFAASLRLNVEQVEALFKALSAPAPQQAPGDGAANGGPRR